MIYNELFDYEPSYAFNGEDRDYNLENKPITNHGLKNTKDQ